MRHHILAALLLAGSCTGPALAGDQVIADFEAATYGNWKTEGTAFGTGPVHAELGIHGCQGTGFVDSFAGTDEATGSLTSPEFKLTHPYLSFLIAGGKDSAQLGLEFWVDGKRQSVTAGDDSGDLAWKSLDLRAFQGKTGQVRIFDQAQGAWGHILVDQITLSDEPRSLASAVRLETYRKSPGYYQERFRPQFHFTPEMNWMNDPNGLVFFDGEYHLFYQHNPHGLEWGHMSWGHAVSRNLVNWEHLPIALHDEYGTMAFSGSAVVDLKNTSGLGSAENPPMVAIYTGEGHKRQTQDLAFSLDHGRTWTKYRENPVLDIGMAEFRDPKVFWYEPDQRWVMVVSLAKDRILHFYGSNDLKRWTFLSKFGPAGVEKKLNWECPDLFEMPIEGEPGKTRWVLKADMGNGAVAGGSGGEYLTGVFDGKEFMADSQESRWIDFGRDFYAPVSWSGVQASDGRRIWLGWMNNWETCLNPTAPWRSAMSVPRSLTLARINGELRLCQTPAREFERLRGTPEELKNLTLNDQAHELKSHGQVFELLLEIEPGSASAVGIRVLKGATEQTVIRYEPQTKQLSVDRTTSGNVDFHPAFAGIHKGPLTPGNDGRIQLRILVDRSSVEVFGNQGETVITDLVFPSVGSDQLELFATGGNSQIISCTVFPLASIWPDNEAK